MNRETEDRIINENLVATLVKLKHGGMDPRAIVTVVMYDDGDFNVVAAVPVPANKVAEGEIVQRLAMLRAAEILNEKATDGGRQYVASPNDPKGTRKL